MQAASGVGAALWLGLADLESSGMGLSSYGFPIARFEVGVWKGMVGDAWQEAKKLFRGAQTWRGNDDEVFIHGSWQLIHGSQAQERSVIAFAASFGVRDAAYQASSWGLFQLLGEHYAEMGYSSAEEMAGKFRSLQEQCDAYLRWAGSNGALDALKRGRPAGLCPHPERGRAGEKVCAGAGQCREEARMAGVTTDTGKISDGYHTFDDLYEHRFALFLNLMKCNLDSAWVSDTHSDGESSYEGWVLAGMELPTGQISYHLPIRLLPFCAAMGVPLLPIAPAWDGHTSVDVVGRLMDNLLREDDKSLAMKDVCAVCGSDKNVRVSSGSEGTNCYLCEECDAKGGN